VSRAFRLLHRARESFTRPAPETPGQPPVVSIGNFLAGPAKRRSLLLWPKVRTNAVFTRDRTRFGGISRGSGRGPVRARVGNRGRRGS
jgi:hypothetical protein